MNNFKNRKQIYKSPGGRSSPPAWKDAYRKKCFERLRARRASLIEQFRSSKSPSKLLISESSSPLKLVSDVMEVEWSSIHQSCSFPSLSLTSSSSSVFNDLDEECTRETLAQIQSELQNADELLLNEFLHFDSQDLQSKVEMFQSNEVICPICKIRPLEEGNMTQRSLNALQTPPRTNLGPMTVLQCNCGLVLTGADFTLNRVRSALQTAICDHENGCVAPLQFTATEDGTGTNLLITCCSCDWMTFLL